MNCRLIYYWRLYRTNERTTGRSGIISKLASTSSSAFALPLPAVPLMVVVSIINPLPEIHQIDRRFTCPRSPMAGGYERKRMRQPESNEDVDYRNNKIEFGLIKYTSPISITGSCIVWITQGAESYPEWPSSAWSMCVFIFVLRSRDRKWASELCRI